MAPRLFKAADVCEMVQVQPYVLRSWEKEFPGIGLQRGDDPARLYRQSDVDQVLRIKQLVFGEGLTLAGARRKLEEMGPASRDAEESSEVLDALASNARTRISRVRQGLQSILTLLSNEPGSMGVANQDYQLEPPPANVRSAAKARMPASRSQPAPVAARKRS